MASVIPNSHSMYCQTVAVGRTAGPSSRDRRRPCASELRGKIEYHSTKKNPLQQQYEIFIVNK